MSETTMVMAGRIEEFRLEDILQAVGSSSLCTAIELRHADGQLHGRIWTQSGRILTAELGGLLGREAFYNLFTLAGGDHFVVQRVRTHPEIDEPLGPVSMMLLEAIERAELARGSQLTPIPSPRPITQDGRWRGIAIAITSMRGGVGRSTVTGELGGALARRGARVLLIDADNSGDLATITGLRHPVARPIAELLDGAAAIDEALVSSDQLPLSLLAPAHGGASDWRRLIQRARERADVVLVDVPAGLEGLSADLIDACAHVIGVVRSDRGAAHAAQALERHLESQEHGPRLAGVVVNLFDGHSTTSLEAFQRIAGCGVPLFETAIPRADAIAADAVACAPGPIAWLFDELAAELAGKLGLEVVTISADDP
jgi:cellulose biosynthesis protein BcsQ